MAEWDEKEREQKTASGRMVRILGIYAVYAVLYGLLFYGIAASCREGYRFCYEVFGPAAVQEASGVETAFQVREEDTFQSVSKRLEEEGLIANWKSFFARMKLTVSDRQKLRQGVYQLRSDMDYKEIINQLTASEGITP